MPYLAHRGLAYPTNPDAPREDWDWKTVPAGAVVDDIPEQSIGWLLQRGAIEELEAPARVQLPEDFPARDLLAAQEITTLKQVEARWDELSSVAGIGPKTLAKIGAALAAAGADHEEEGQDG